MGDHFGCIGFDADDCRTFEAFAREAASQAAPVSCKRGTYLHWSSGCGAELWLHLDRRGVVVGAQPHFYGSGAVSVAVTRTVARAGGAALDGGFQCWANPCSSEPDSGDYPFVFDAPDYHLHAPELALPARATVQLAAFAEQLQCFPSAEAYAERRDEVRLAVRSFVPAGLVDMQGEASPSPAALAVLSGEILDAGVRENPISGQRFLWAAVQTDGATLDVVASPASVPDGFVPGGVVQGLFWLSGRLSGYPPRRGLRLIG